jgi:hypothetical protein
MIFLYTLALLFLGALKFLFDRKAARLERKHARAAKLADAMAREPVYRPGTSKLDAYQIAKRQYLLGSLVQKAEQLEATYLAWQGRADRLQRVVAGVRGWQGRKLPYTMGVVDVSLALALLDHLGIDRYVGWRQLFELVRSWITG